MTSCPTAAPAFCVVSSRDDGLCQRLNTILDAMLIAKALNAEFGYHWSETDIPARDQQATASLEAVFNVEFRRHHRCGRPDLHAPVLTPPLRDASAVAAARALGEAAGQLLVDRAHDLEMGFPGLGPFAERSYAEAFASIGFAPPVRAAIAAAQSVPITLGAAAVHVRGGDILHGTHSFHGTYLHKAPSLIEIDVAVRTLSGEGREVWLIGQEPDIQAAMVARHLGARAFGITDRLPTLLTQVGAVLFDAVLLSRMTYICGGRSGVTQLARRIGGTGFTDIGSAAASDDEELTCAVGFPTEFSGVSAAAQAHTFGKLVVAVSPACWTARHLSMIRTARSIRPANAFLQLVEVCVIARVVGAQDGERAARAFLIAPQLESEVAPDIGFAFLLRGKEFFPLRMTSALKPEAGPASNLLFSVGEALADATVIPRAFDALADADTALAPEAIDLDLRERLLSCLKGKVGSWDTIAWKPRAQE